MRASAASASIWAIRCPNRTTSPSAYSTASDRIVAAKRYTGCAGGPRRRCRLGEVMHGAATTASITVVYLARLREAFGVATERIAPAKALTTVGELRTWLAARGGVWATELAPGRAVRIA